MSESIIATLRFTGTAKGSFAPPEQVFVVPRELILGAVRITINGTHPGRSHETNVSLSFENDIYVNSTQLDVLDGEPTTSSFRSLLSRLVTGYNYKLGLYVSGFDHDGEEVAISVDLLELDTTLAQVTKGVLMDAEEELRINAMTFGISEATFTSLITQQFTSPEIKVGRTAGLNMILSMEWDDYPPWPYVKLDVVAKVFVIHGDLLLTFKPVNGGEFFEAVAGVRATLELRCHPAMVTSTDDTLQLQFDSATLSNLDVSIYDEAPIFAEFESVPGFKEAVDAYVDQLVTRTGPLGFALPAYLETRAIPDYWHHVMNMELAFRRFDYRNVKVHGYTIAYLFMVFSVKGLDLPLPCYCDNEWAAVREAQSASVGSVQELDAPAATVEDVKALAASVKSFAGRKRGRERATAVDNLTAATSTAISTKSDAFPTAPYFNIIVAAQVSSIGFSQNTFREITRPIAEMGLDESVSTGGTIYVSARAWARSKLESAEILSDGIKAVIDVKAEGTARAAIRSNCGRGDVASASARLRITVNDSSLQWRLRISQEGASPYALIVEADPTVSIGKPDVKFDSALDPPPPLDKVDDWIFERVAVSIKPVLEIIVREKARLRLIRSVENNGNITLRFVDDVFYQGEAAVIMGQLGQYFG